MKIFAKLHNKLGDFWWFSLLLFFSSRIGDVFSAFIGLWLVPKYVGASELGAVLPLISFSGFLSMPLNIFATIFMKEITTLATHKEFGKMKSLMKSVFWGAAIFLVLAILISNLVLPLFLERIRIEKGSLGILIISSAFIAAVCPMYVNALQALKRFKAISIINFLGAPIRFIALVITMPFRALSGYFIGQAAQPAFAILASIVSLRRELSVKAEPYWNKQIFKRFSLFFILLLIYNFSGGILGLTEQTVLRQRIPEVESAAYYMVTRFAEIAGLIGCTFTTIMFPFTAEMSERGQSTKPIVKKSIYATLFSCVVLATVFFFACGPVLSFLPDGEKYTPYTWAVPWLIGISAISLIQHIHISTEISAGRFKFLKWWFPLNIALTVILLVITGYGYFSNYLPATWNTFLATNNFTSLKAMLYWFTISTVIKTAFSVWDFTQQKNENQ